MTANPYSGTLPNEPRGYYYDGPSMLRAAMGGYGEKPKFDVVAAETDRRIDNHRARLTEEVRRLDEFIHATDVVHGPGLGAQIRQIVTEIDSRTAKLSDAQAAASRIRDDELDVVRQALTAQVSENQAARDRFRAAQMHAEADLRILADELARRAARARKPLPTSLAMIVGRHCTPTADEAPF